MNGTVQPKGTPVVGPAVLRRIAPQPPPPLVAKSPAVTPPGKRVVMRLKCRYRPLHQSYLQNGQIVDRDTDVTFICSDGGVVKGHKIILASSSKYFTSIFKEQIPGEMSVVSVPDVRSDVMKLVLTMSYKDNVVVTSEQMEQLKEAAGVFAINWDRLKREGGNEVALDVKPGKVMDGPVMPPPPPLIKPTLQQPLPHGVQPQRRIMNNRVQGQQQDSGMRYVGGSPGKPQTAIRSGNSGMHQASTSQNYPGDRDGGGDSDESEDSSSDFQFQLQGYDRSAENHQERRKSKLTPRVETEMDDADGANNVDPEQAQKMIKEWMDQVGKADNPEAKRPRMDPAGGRNYQHGAQECTVCNATFVKKEAYKWHEHRHVGLGLFKCSRCDQLLKTARAVWVHEQNQHAYCGIGVQELEEPRGIPSNFQIVEGRGRQPQQQGYQHQVRGRPQQMVGNRNMTAAQSAKFNQIRRLKAAAAGLKRGPNSQLARNFSHKNPTIEIGHSEGSEQLDTKKIKQLHWLYVCGKCDNCSDSSVKAVVHYRKCYPTQGVPFENTVTKYRQGFYGKSRCPLCPRRYVANGGFMIHCGHHHSEYRRLFSHTGAAEDKLKCVNCQRKFVLPEEFHEHLDDGECNNSPINEESMPLLSSSRSGSGTTPLDRNKRRTIVSSRSAKPYQASPPTPSSAVPPRSARLAQRASVKRALAEAAEQESNGRGGVVRRRESGIDYPPADCPICGAQEVANISQHLASDHHDLDVTVNRISTDLLRCRKCLITFAICDLLEHTNSCSAKLDDSVVEENQKVEPEDTESVPTAAAAAATTSKAEVKPNKVEAKVKADPKTFVQLDLPPGIGVSPIDRMENTDLFCKETLRRAMECGVCGKTSLKLGDIALCLRGHGVHRCALCFNSYTDRSLYPQHLKTCHGAGNMTNKLKCPLCSKTFFNAGQVAGHMYNNHWTALLSEMKQEVRLNGWFLKADPSTEEEKTNESVTDGNMEVDEDVNGNDESKTGDEEEKIDEEEEEDANKANDSSEVEKTDENSPEFSPLGKDALVSNDLEGDVTEDEAVEDKTVDG